MPKNNKQIFSNCQSEKTFQKIFLKNENKDLLLCILQTALNIKINNIEIQNNQSLSENCFGLLVKTDIGYIDIEINEENKNYLNYRNFSLIGDLYRQYTLNGGRKKVIQLNLTYGLNPEDEEPFISYTLTDGIKNYIDNFSIIVCNMDKILKFWYACDEENIKKYKYLLMLGLNIEELVKLPKDKTIEKFINELKKLNHESTFISYITKEADEKLRRNTELNEAYEEGIITGKNKVSKNVAKKMLNRNMNINDIIEITSLTEKEISKL